MKQCITHLVVSFCTLVIAGCSSSSPMTSRPTQYPTGRVVEVTLQHNCPLENIAWLTVDHKADKQLIASYARQLVQAALLDANQIQNLSSQGKPILELASALQKSVDSLSNQRILVSQDFYKEYTSSRTSLCAVLEAIRRGSIKKEDIGTTAEMSFRKIATSFEKYL